MCTAKLPGMAYHSRRAIAVIALAALIGAMPVVRAQQAPDLRALYVKAEYMIPMRDGVRLYTSVYSPRGKPGRHPILLERTPYGAGPYGPDAYRDQFRGSRQFIDAGYIFAFQDVRGRGHSEGIYENIRPQLIVSLKPHDIDESTDTWDTIDYLVKHVPDHNGRVGLWGISYPGYYAGIGAVCAHPALRVVSPQAPVSDWFLGDDFHHNGALFLMDAVGFARFGESAKVAASYTLPRLDTQGDPVRFFLKQGTLASLTKTYFAQTDGMWRYVVDHGTYDDYWQTRSLPYHLRGVRCPMLIVGGWFDAEDCWGALHTARAAFHQIPRIRATLVMGPWWHGGWARGTGDRIGKMSFGQSASVYYRRHIEFPFMDACLRGNGRPSLPVAEVFETGADRWRTFREWPPRGLKAIAFYMLPGKGLGVGTAASAATAEYDQYVSNPADPVPYEGGAIHNRTREYMVDDQRFAAARPDVLVYESAPLDKPLTIAGPLTADLYVSSTGTDADFVVKVIDVHPDSEQGMMAGYENLIRADVMRAKFRDSYQNPSPLQAGAVTHVTFQMADLLHTFETGHRIMVQVQSSWFPLVDRNPQKFVDIYRARPEDFQKATIRLYHTARYRSCVRVGLLSAGEAPPAKSRSRDRGRH